MKKILYVEGMSCDHCVQRVTMALQGVEGLSEILVDLRTGKAQARAGLVDDAALHAAVENAGYKVTHIQSLKE